MSQNLLILGATSDMALAIARRFGAAGYNLMLAARSIDRLQPMQADLTIRHKVKVDIVQFDALEVASHQEFYNRLPVKPDLAICVFGLLGSQKKAETDWDACAQILFSNYVGAVSILNVIANDMEKRRSGTIVGISSVAGERGRQSNYFYGSAKAGFTTYLAGLRNRLFKSGVHVLTVKPGFVRTKMIDNLKTPERLTADPKEVAEAIFNAVKARKNEIYTRGSWRWIMFAIRNIPESMFKRMNL